MGFSYLDLAALPKQYDIVWCLYPRREDKLLPGPVARPCLVLDVRVELSSKRAALLVAYGTGNLLDGSNDLIIDDWGEVHALGLHKPTRFALSPEKRMLLPWCVEYFVPPSYVAETGLVAGALTDKQIARLTQSLDARGLERFTS
jgi:hypothetical protein